MLGNSVSFTFQRILYILGGTFQDWSKIGYWHSDLLIGSLDSGFESEIPGFIMVQAICGEREANHGG